MIKNLVIVIPQLKNFMKAKLANNNNNNNNTRSLVRLMKELLDMNKQ